MDRDIRGHIVRHALILGMAFLAAIAFFVLYEGAPWGTAAYYVAMIVTLVGSNYEPHTALGLAVSILLAFVSVGVLLSLVGQVFGPQLVSAIRRRARMTRINLGDHHVIVVGASDTAWAVAGSDRARSILILRTQEDFEIAERRGFEAIRGDPSHAAALREAGIDRCAAVLALSSEDAINAFVTLNAKRLRPDVRVIARISHEDHRESLVAAGADEVICPGTLTAKAILAELPAS